MKIVVCVPGFRPDGWIDALKDALPEAEVTAWSKDLAPNADYAVVWAPDRLLFQNQPNLKAVFNLGAGVDALLRIDTLPENLPVVRLGDAGMSVQMAEYVCQAVTRFARSLARSEREMAEGIWNQRMPKPRHQSPVGVMGLGAIGSRVAQALVAFEYPVLGWSRSEKTLPGVTCYAGAAQLDAFLSATRILVCTLPLTPETFGILRHDTLGKLLPNGYLINVGRGAHLVEEDLIALVESGRMAGATLDVFQNEPLSTDHPFRNYPSIVMTPHISAVTIREESIGQIAEKMRRFDQGQSIDGLVDRQRGY